MKRRSLIRALRETLAACGAASLLGAGSLMPLHPTAEPSDSAPHSSRHVPSDHHKGPANHQTDCCTLCSFQCAALGLAHAQAAVPETPLPCTRSSTCRRSGFPTPRLRHRLPPSQGPPFLLG